MPRYCVEYTRVTRHDIEADNAKEAVVAVDGNLMGWTEIDQPKSYLVTNTAGESKRYPMTVVEKLGEAMQEEF